MHTKSGMVKFFMDTRMQFLPLVRLQGNISKLQDILKEVKKAVLIINPNYDIVLKTLFMLWHEISYIWKKWRNKFDS